MKRREVNGRKGGEGSRRKGETREKEERLTEEMGTQGRWGRRKRGRGRARR